MIVLYLLDGRVLICKVDIDFFAIEVVVRESGVDLSEGQVADSPGDVLRT